MWSQHVVQRGNGSHELRKIYVLVSSYRLKEACIYGYFKNIL
mgnify:CR=1 FL=1